MNLTVQELYDRLGRIIAAGGGNMSVRIEVLGYNPDSCSTERLGADLETVEERPDAGWVYLSGNE